MANELLLKMGVETSGVAAGAEEAVEQVKSAQQDLSASTAQAAKEDADHLALVEAQYGQLGPAAAKAYGQASAAADAAGEAVARAGKQAETGGNRYERAAAQAAVAINKLEKEIEELRAAGGDVKALEGRLDSLRASAQKNSETFGVFRSKLRDVQDETKIATRAAGEYEGTLSSLEDVVNSVNPALGNQVVKLLAVQSALFIVQQIGRDAAAGMKDLALAFGVSEEAAQKFADGIEARFSLNPIESFMAGFKDASDQQVGFYDKLIGKIDELQAAASDPELEANLRKVLDASGIETAGLSLDELVLAYERAIKAGSTFAQGMQDEERQAEALAESIRGNTKSLDERERVLVRTIELLRSQGDLTEKQAAGAAEALSKEIDTLERFGRVVADEVKAARDEFQALADTTKRIDLSRAVEQAEALGDGLLASGEVSKKAAAEFAASVEKIKAQIASLPEGQREAFAFLIEGLGQTVTAVNEAAVQYEAMVKKREEGAAAIKKAEEDWLAREKEIYQERQELLSTFASVFEQLQAKLNGKDAGDGSAEQIAALKQELTGLQKLDVLTPEQLNRMNELSDELATAVQGTFEFGKAQEQAALSVEDVDAAMAGLLDSLKATEGGFKSLPLASRDAIANMLDRLQETAARGHATGDVLKDTFEGVGRVVEQAGGTMGELGTSLKRASEDTLDLDREFGELEASITATSDATGKLGEAQKDASTLAKERAEAAVKAANEEADAVNVAKEAHAGVVGFLKEEVDLSARLLVIWKELKECMASASF